LAVSIASIRLQRGEEMRGTANERVFVENYYLATLGFAGGAFGG
jgi:hypothetical protein